MGDEMKELIDISNQLDKAIEEFKKFVNELSMDDATRHSSDELLLKLRRNKLALQEYISDAMLLEQSQRI